MKKMSVAVLVISFLASSACFAQIRTFQGKATWSKLDMGAQRAQFSDLEQKGVERSAEEDAINQCLTAGATDCAAVNAMITKCNGMDLVNGNWGTLCSATAIAQGQVSSSAE